MSWNNWLKRLWNRSGARKSSLSRDGRAVASMARDAQGRPVRARLRVGAVTTVGNHREHNEDNFFVPGLGSLDSWPEGLASSAEGILAPRDDRGAPIDNGHHHRSATQGAARLEVDGPFIVADGMGGQLAGEQASRIAVEVIPKELAQRLGNGNDGNIETAIRSAIAAANREIIAQSHVVPECSNMGTTVVLAYFRPGRVYVAGIGDSRAYRLRGNTLERLTRDHDLASALISAGTIRPEEAEKHQFRHVLYLYLGSPEARDGPEDVRVEDVLPGDRFLLASDGLTGSVSDEALTAMLRDGDDPQTIARDLVRLALQNESRDNVTCMVIAVDGLPDEPSTEPTRDRS